MAETLTTLRNSIKMMATSASGMNVKQEQHAKSAKRRKSTFRFISLFGCGLVCLLLLSAIHHPQLLVSAFSSSASNRNHFHCLKGASSCSSSASSRHNILMVANPSSSSQKSNDIENDDDDASYNNNIRANNANPNYKQGRKYKNKLKSSSSAKIMNTKTTKYASKNNYNNSSNNNNNNKPKNTYNNNNNNMMSSAAIAARTFNKELIQCDTAKELLACFMEQSTTNSITSTTNTGSTVASSSATHLSGASKLNSVNFSTCLHRLARFVTFINYNNNNSNKQQQQQQRGNTNNYNNNNNNASVNDNEEQRKQVLNDPRFALLVCSMAEMAAGANPAMSVGEANGVLDTWRRMGTGAVVNHGNDKDEYIYDWDDRFDLAAKCMNQLSFGNGDGSDDGDSDASNYAFSSRECSNVCWALAKLRLNPPSVAFPLGRVVQGGKDEGSSLNDNHSDDNVIINGNIDNGHFFDSGDNNEKLRQFVSIQEMSLDVISSSLQVRLQLLEEARKRRTAGAGGGSNTGAGGGWIPELSRLAGKVLDLIAVQIIQEYKLRDGAHISSSGSDGGKSGGMGAAGGFNPQEMANVLYSFAKAKRGDHSLFDAVADELMMETHKEIARGGQGPKPQELSNSIWAFATAGIRGDTQVALVKFMADALDEGNGQFFGFDFKPQELSNTAWALATLHSRRGGPANNNQINQQHKKTTEAMEDDGIVRILRWVAKVITERTNDFKPQELSNSVWAFSTIGFGYDESCGTNAHNDYVHVMSDAPLEDKTLVFTTLETIAENALPRLGKFKAQELNNLAWGFARLGHRTERSEQLFRGVGEELKRRGWQFKPQDVGTTLWSFATAEYFDYEAYRAGASRLNFQHIRSFKPQEMSNTLWALATAGFSPEHIRAFDTTLVPASKRPTMAEITSDPFTECFAAVAVETMRRPHDFKDQELKDVLWSFSKSGVRHPALFKKVAEHLVGRSEAISSPGTRGFSTFSSQGLGNTLWSFAKQAQLSQEVIESLGDLAKVGSTGRLAVYETSCLDIGEQLIKRLFASAAESGMEESAGGLDRFKNQDISNVVWAFSTLGLLHSKFFKQTELQVLSRINSRTNNANKVFKAQEIANLLWSFATLNVQPESGMIDALSSYMASECRGRNGFDEYSIAKIFKRQELTNIAWSCAVLGRYPKELMEILYTGIFGTSNDPKKMKQIFKDDGLQKSSIMTFYYVQVAADIEAPQLKLSLPIGFPKDWGEDDEGGVSSKSDGDVDELVQMSSSMLTLTTSKFQRDVSDTFSDIGFDNILEHVIDTTSIKDEYGVHLPSNPQDFLSIDIANIKKRIGIEVDGPAHFVQIIDGKTDNGPTKSILVSGEENDLLDRGDNRVNGPTTLKHRLLTHLGWNIIHLPYWEYQGLGKDKNKERSYCQSVLDESMS